MSSDHNWVGLMAKMPELGKVKTRLAVDIGPQNALRIYETLLSSTIIKCLPAQNHNYRLAAFVTPQNCVEHFNSKYSGLDLYLPQSEGSLGSRMKDALHYLMQRSTAKKAVLIGADIPGLDSSIISEALHQLDNREVVFGPTSDGGYYLIGMKDKIFDNLLSDKISWGTDQVLKESIKISSDDNINYALLNQLDDLDDSSDLAKFPAIVAAARFPSDN